MIALLLLAQLIAVTPADYPALPSCGGGSQVDCVVGFAFTDTANGDLGHLVTTAHSAPGWWYDDRYGHWHGRYWSKDWRIVAIVQRAGGIQEQVAMLENVERKPKPPILEVQ